MRSGRPLRVLIVEDHALIALDLQLTLAEHGAEIVGIAASGEDGVALARRLRPDLVLMDVRLAGAIDGIDAATAVADIPGTRLVFVTGNNDEPTLARIRRIGSFPVVAKPVLTSELLRAIRSACGLGTAPAD
jgi:DNA-binding NarL/FixJ family response regulator